MQTPHTKDNANTIFLRPLKIEDVYLLCAIERHRWDATLRALTAGEHARRAKIQRDYNYIDMLYFIESRRTRIRFQTCFTRIIRIIRADPVHPVHYVYLTYIITIKKYYT